jgi:glutamate formiminotransferase/formiminotetrahydrofolate cyclodeaminase
MNRILECIPNFSEGRNTETINHIVAAIASVKGVNVLHVDSGKAANRTVVTFAGDPDSVTEAAFRGAKKATEVIDMTKQTGEHPRFGAMDVCPLVPISGITMSETVAYARKLGKRIGEELGIHVYSYANAAFTKERENLAYCRAGEYEGLKAKLAQPDGKPDFGPLTLNARSGASAVGARDILIAYNVNLNTSSVQIAKAIACEVREKGKFEGKNKSDISMYTPGLLKSVKAIGWYIEEFGFAQVSMNLTNVNITPLHVAFDAVCKRAEAHGAKVTGSEIIGLVPLKSMLEAGAFFLQGRKLPVEVSDNELIEVAIRELGLSQLYTFNPDEKIIELAMKRVKEEEFYKDHHP